MSPPTGADPKPMDPKHLADMRADLQEWLAAGSGGLCLYTSYQVEELLADRFYWEAEAKRWRSRCPVTAEDVEASGVTFTQVLQWCDAHPGWLVTHDPMNAWVTSALDEEEGYDPRGCNEVSRLINASAGDDSCSAFAILDEMATLAPETP